MPNWCLNTLNIEGQDKSEITNLVGDFKRRAKEYRLSRFSSNKILSLNSFIQYPSKFRSITRRKEEWMERGKRIIIIRFSEYLSNHLDLSFFQIANNLRESFNTLYSITRKLYRIAKRFRKLIKQLKKTYNNRIRNNYINLIRPLISEMYLIITNRYFVNLTKNSFLYILNSLYLHKGFILRLGSIKKTDDGYNSGGYEWCIKNWDTKWEIRDPSYYIDGSKVSYYFDTAYSPPVNPIKVMSKAYPTFDFTLRYEITDGKGIIKFKDGEITEDYELPPYEKKEKINEYLSLALTFSGNTEILVKGEPFKTCVGLLLNINRNNISLNSTISSIDEAEGKLSHIDGNRKKFSISPETEFKAHLSNLEVWCENNYNTNLLHRSIAFPLLKELTICGDPKAEKKYKEEIITRFMQGYPPTQAYLLQNRYLNIFTKEELEFLQRDINKEKIASHLMLELFYDSNKDAYFRDFIPLLKRLKGFLHSDIQPFKKRYMRELKSILFEYEIIRQKIGQKRIKDLDIMHSKLLDILDITSQKHNIEDKKIPYREIFMCSFFFYIIRELFKKIATIIKDSSHISYTTKRKTLLLFIPIINDILRYYSSNRRISQSKAYMDLKKIKDFFKIRK